jgi:hypothetical protein
MHHLFYPLLLATGANLTIIYLGARFVTRLTRQLTTLESKMETTVEAAKSHVEAMVAEVQAQIAADITGSQSKLAAVEVGLAADLAAVEEKLQKRLTLHGEFLSYLDLGKRDAPGLRATKPSL